MRLEGPSNFMVPDLKTVEQQWDNLCHSVKNRVPKGGLGARRFSLSSRVFLTLKMALFCPLPFLGHPSHVIMLSYDLS